MKYEEERKNAISYCGVYCLKCDWNSGRIKQAADDLLQMIKERPELRDWCEGEEKGKYDVENFTKILEYLSKTGFCRFTCKQGSGWNGCPIRRCCESKGLAFCCECEEFPCKRWGRWPFDETKLNNLKQIKEVGAEEWIKKQWE